MRVCVYPTERSVNGELFASQLYSRLIFPFAVVFISKRYAILSEKNEKNKVKLEKKNENFYNQLFFIVRKPYDSRWEW